jgi:phage-related holin
VGKACTRYRPPPILKQHMKTSILGYLGLLFIKVSFIPSVSLLAWVFIAIAFDFLTGVIKSKVLKQAITSTGFRKSVVKTLQYLGIIIGGIILTNTATGQSEIVEWINDGLLLFIVYVEVYSILENFYAMEPGSKISEFIIRPLMSILSLSLTKNPFAKPPTDTKAVWLFALLLTCFASCTRTVYVPGQHTTITKDSIVFKPVLVDTTIYLPGDSVVITDSIPYCPDLVYSNVATKGRVSAKVAISNGKIKVKCNEAALEKQIQFWKQDAEYWKSQQRTELKPYPVEVVKYKPPKWAWVSVGLNILLLLAAGLAIRYL